MVLLLPVTLVRHSRSTPIYISLQQRHGGVQARCQEQTLGPTASQLLAFPYRALLVNLTTERTTASCAQTNCKQGGYPGYPYKSRNVHLGHRLLQSPPTMRVPLAKE
jgi:hypothetical protein